MNLALLYVTQYMLRQILQHGVAILTDVDHRAIHRVFVNVSRQLEQEEQKHGERN